MTYSEFKAKWLGKPINYDNAYGAQCVDVYRMYVKEVLNIPQSPPIAGAKNIWDTYLSEYFERISNTPDGVPEQGCIAIWNVGEFGHVGIVDSADKQYLTCFEQNWTEMNGTGVSELRRHTYANVLGWLKPKSSLYKGQDLSNKEAMMICVDVWRDLMDGKYMSTEEHNQIIKELDSKSTEQATQYAKEKQILEDKIKALDNALFELQNTEHTWQDAADNYQRKLQAVIVFIQKQGIPITIESTEDEITASLSSATHTDEIANLYSALSSRLILKDHTPSAVLEAIGGLEMEYNKKLENLKKPTLLEQLLNIIKQWQKNKS